MRRIPFSGENVDIVDLGTYHSDFDGAIRSYFSPSTNTYVVRFTGYSRKEIDAELNSRINEFDMASSFTILSAVEAMFRIDYLQRCYQRLKDPLSRAFRDLHNRKTIKVSLEDDILELWKQHTNGSTQVIGDLRGAFRFRHWLAHGRYWNPKLGRNYDFASVFALASTVVESFPLVGVDQRR